MGKAAVDSPPVSSAGGLVIIVLVAAAKASADADAVERCMHAYAPFGCLCVGSVISVFQIPWPPCSFFYRTTTSATPSTRILHRIRHSVLLGPFLRARREESACVLFIFASTTKKSRERESETDPAARRLCVTDLETRAHNTAKNHRAHTHELFCSLLTQHSSSSHLSLERRQTTEYYSLLYSYTTTPVCSLPRRPRIVPQNVQILPTHLPFTLHKNSEHL